MTVTHQVEVKSPFIAFYDEHVLLLEECATSDDAAASVARLNEHHAAAPQFSGEAWFVTDVAVQVARIKRGEPPMNVHPTSVY